MSDVRSIIGAYHKDSQGELSDSIPFSVSFNNVVDNELDTPNYTLKQFYNNYRNFMKEGEFIYSGKEEPLNKNITVWIENNEETVLTGPAIIEPFPNLEVITTGSYLFYFDTDISNIKDVYFNNTLLKKDSEYCLYKQDNRNYISLLSFFNQRFSSLFEITYNIKYFFKFIFNDNSVTKYFFIPRYLQIGGTEFKDNFSKVKINGVVISSENYEVLDNGIVLLKGSYINSLPPGKYNGEIYFSNGTTHKLFYFSVKNKNNENYKDKLSFNFNIDFSINPILSIEYDNKKIISNNQYFIDDNTIKIEEDLKKMIPGKHILHIFCEDEKILYDFFYIGNINEEKDLIFSFPEEVEDFKSLTIDNEEDISEKFYQLIKDVDNCTLQLKYDYYSKLKSGTHSLYITFGEITRKIDFFNAGKGYGLDLYDDETGDRLINTIPELIGIDDIPETTGQGESEIPTLGPQVEPIG